MYKLNPAVDILRENITTFKERHEFVELLESSAHEVNNALVTRLYKSAIDKSHIDFGRIPESAGDITKYAGFKSMQDSISVLNELKSKSGVDIPELETVSTAIQNVVSQRDLFEKGFRLDKKFIIVQYNMIVYACVASVSAIISSYVDFVKRMDKVEFELVKGADRNGNLMIQSLDAYNASVRKGDFVKAINGILNTGAEGFIGGMSVATVAIIVGAIASIIPVTRELIFLGYYSRMKLSDYLEQQAALIDANRQGLDSFVGTPSQKQEIIRKQTAHAEKLRKLSEKVRVNRTMAERDASVNLQKENRTWSLGEIRSDVVNSNTGGFQLI